MLESKHVATLLAVGTSFIIHDGAPLINATMYRQVVSGPFDDTS